MVHHGSAVAALAADADAAGTPAAVAEGRAALGAHPVAAAVVLLRLLPQALLQEAQKLLRVLLGESGPLQLLQGPDQVL